MKESVQEGPLADAVRAAVRAYLGSVPEAFAERHAAARRVRALVTTEVVAGLQPSANRHFAGKPHETLRDKQAVASEVNAALHEVGLSLACPRSGEPSILVADFKDAEHAATGRFRFETRDATGRKSRLAATSGFPVLELVEDPPRREGGRRTGGLGVPQGGHSR